MWKSSRSTPSKQQGWDRIRWPINTWSFTPDNAWDELKRFQTIDEVVPTRLNTEVNPEEVRFVCMADTHALTSAIRFPIPPGDVFIHAGDFTMGGTPSEVRMFNTFLGSLPHKYKIVIAGNHELCLDPSLHDYEAAASSIGNTNVRETLLRDCIYLQDSATSVYGINIYGSPWVPRCNGWAFSLPRGDELLRKWSQIPCETDILVTHTPALGHGDTLVNGSHVGCFDLLYNIQRRVKPPYHVFGHIHEGYGTTTDHITKYINCSTCTFLYEPVNSPVVFDVPLGPGHRKL